MLFDQILGNGILYKTQPFIFKNNPLLYLKLEKLYDKKKTTLVFTIILYFLKNMKVVHKLRIKAVTKSEKHAAVTKKYFKI